MKYRNLGIKNSHSCFALDNHNPTTANTSADKLSALAGEKLDNYANALNNIGFTSNNAGFAGSSLFIKLGIKWAENWQ